MRSIRKLFVSYPIPCTDSELSHEEECSDLGTALEIATTNTPSIIYCELDDGERIILDPLIN